MHGGAMKSMRRMGRGEGSEGIVLAFRVVFYG